MSTCRTHVRRAGLPIGAPLAFRSLGPMHCGPAPIRVFKSNRFMECATAARVSIFHYWQGTAGKARS
ncbi:MAG TPA: hypothetical protein VNE58_11815 [Casimicrobiaceae bacterium]|nr:hypothetical protein [Casimicrobiaceae bacterium]